MAAVLVAGTCALAQAEPEENRFQGIDNELMSLCREVRPMCWKPVAEHLSLLGIARSKREREEQLMAYYMLGKTAYMTGDFPESARLYAETLRLAHEVAFEGHSTEVIFKPDVAMLYLSTHDYAQALRLVDEYLTYIALLGAKEHDAKPVLLLRAGALIGLKRTDEADRILQAMLDTLDFDGVMPWEGTLVGPAPLDPFLTGRRIAAHYQREGQYAKALALLQSLESKRRASSVQAMPDEQQARRWPSQVHPADMLDDQAALYLAQGNDAVAGPLLRQSLKLRENTAGAAHKQVLGRLAGIARRAGQAAAADKYDARAAAVKNDARHQWRDPLADTLGLPD